jgi:hypothetical protein
MSRPPRESLDYDTWLQQRAGVFDGDDESAEPDRGDDRDEPDDFEDL